MTRHAIIIVDRMQEEHLQGSLPGLYAMGAGALRVGDEVLFRRAAGLDPSGYFASALLKGIDRVGQDVLLRFTPLVFFRQVIDPEPSARVLAYAREIDPGESAALSRFGGRMDGALPVDAGFAEPQAEFDDGAGEGDDPDGAAKPDHPDPDESL